MMWFMMRGGKQQQQQSEDGSLPDLRAEQARLAEKIAVLEQQKTPQTPEPDISEAQSEPVNVR